ncbi:DUF6962 family protein [Crocinitomix algicola]|uniref:DUF6962 family protein n=1 Tax=Crocinitomix algicola TaxID=1740263 RepID=UPI000873230B|nr:hypothetical protein [Crocinitomix algicola]
MIGADFEKIHFVLFGLDLVEPMAFITDTILGITSIVLGLLLSKIKIEHPFRTYWIWFFLIFGLGAFVGGLGHVFFNYWGVAGKFPSWISGPIAIFLLEQGMIAVHPNETKLSLFKSLSFWKMILVFVIFTLVCLFAPIQENPRLAFLPTAINTIFGVILTAGVLGNFYAKKIDINFKYFVFGVITLTPTAFIFLMKINLHPWFDKNDLSHVLMVIGISFFYVGVKKAIQKVPAIA